MYGTIGHELMTKKFLVLRKTLPGKNSSDYLALMLESDWIIFINRAPAWKKIIFEGCTNIFLSQCFDVACDVLLCVALKTFQKPKSTRQSCCETIAILWRCNPEWFSHFFSLSRQVQQHSRREKSWGGKLNHRKKHRDTMQLKKINVNVYTSSNALNSSSQPSVKWNDELKWMSVEYHFVTIRLIRLNDAGFYEV